MSEGFQPGTSHAWEKIPQAQGGCYCRHCPIRQQILIMPMSSMPAPSNDAPPRPNSPPSLLYFERRFIGPPLISELYGGRLKPVETVSAAGSSPCRSPVASHIAAVTRCFQSCILPTKGVKPNRLPGFISLEHPFATELELSHSIVPCVISILWERRVFFSLWFNRPCPDILQSYTLQWHLPLVDDCRRRL